MPKKWPRFLPGRALVLPLTLDMFHIILHVFRWMRQAWEGLVTCSHMTCSLSDLVRQRQTLLDGLCINHVEINITVDLGSRGRTQTQWRRLTFVLRLAAAAWGIESDAIEVRTLRWIIGQWTNSWPDDDESDRRPQRRRIDESMAPEIRRRLLAIGEFVSVLHSVITNGRGLMVCSKTRTSRSTPWTLVVC